MSAIAATSQKENSEKPHLGIVIVGHVDAGKSTTTGQKKPTMKRLMEKIVIPKLSNSLIIHQKSIK